MQFTGLEYKNRKYKGQKYFCQTELCDLSMKQFIGRFLLHELPSGFMRIRHFGFLVPFKLVSAFVWQKIALKVLIQFTWVRKRRQENSFGAYPPVGRR
ncbi:MAG: hypothetical protein GY757_23055 [bacterium]|nr:hypothetical protein [bacterium]